MHLSLVVPNYLALQVSGTFLHMCTIAQAWSNGNSMPNRKYM